MWRWLYFRERASSVVSVINSWDCWNQTHDYYGFLTVNASKGSYWIFIIMVSAATGKWPSDFLKNVIKTVKALLPDDLFEVHENGITCYTHSHKKIWNLLLLQNHVNFVYLQRNIIALRQKNLDSEYNSIPLFTMIWCVSLRPSGWVDLELWPGVWSNPAPNLGL